MDFHIGDLLKRNHMAYKYAQLRYIEDVPVRDYMTRDVITIEPDKSLAEAARLFIAHSISGLPVVDQIKTLQGILTEADLLAAIGLPCKHPACGVWRRLEYLFRNENRIRGLTGSVADLMYNKPVYVQESRLLYQAVELMKKKHVKKLIVTDEGKHVSGIITRGSLIRAFLDYGAMGASSGFRRI